MWLTHGVSTPSMPTEWIFKCASVKYERMMSHVPLHFSLIPLPSLSFTHLLLICKEIHPKQYLHNAIWNQSFTHLSFNGTQEELPGLFFFIQPNAVFSDFSHNDSTATSWGSRVIYCKREDVNTRRLGGRSVVLSMCCICPSHHS